MEDAAENSSTNRASIWVASNFGMLSQKTFIPIVQEKITP